MTVPYIDPAILTQQGVAGTAHTPPEFYDVVIATINALIDETGGGTVGPGTSGTLAKFTGTNTIGNSSITDDGAIVATTSIFYAYGAGSDRLQTGAFGVYRPGVLFLRANGAVGSPTGVVTDDVLSGLTVAGYTSAGAFTSGDGVWETHAAETWTAGAHGLYHRFFIISPDSTTRYTALKLDYDGNVGVGNYDTAVGGKVPYGFTVKGSTITACIEGYLRHQGAQAGFFGTTPTTKPTVSGSRYGNAALESALTGIAGLGLITNSTTAGTAPTSLQVNTYSDAGANPIDPMDTTAFLINQGGETPSTFSLAAGTVDGHSIQIIIESGGATSNCVVAVATLDDEEAGTNLTFPHTAPASITLTWSDFNQQWYVVSLRAVTIA